MKINAKLWAALGLAVILTLLTFSLAVFPASAGGTWYVVTTGDDANDCLSPATACATINGALNKPGFVAGDTVLVASGTFADTGNEVVLLNKNATLSGGWDADFNIQSGMSTIDGERVRRVMTVNTGVNASITSFRISNGFVTRSIGGGILNRGTLNVMLSAFSANVSEAGDGGALYNSGNMTVTNSNFSGNTAGGRGSGNGGGIFNRGTLMLVGSTFGSNRAISGCGGGAHNHPAGNLTIANSTFSGNSAFRGGGVCNNGVLVINNGTFSGNSASLRGGNAIGSSATVFLRNTIATGGIPDNCSGFIISQGYNLASDASCRLIAIGDLPSTDPLLGPLQDNGGPTDTHALQGDSPAIDAGNPASPGSGSTACLATDQRGVGRPQGAACDIGAFELEMIQVVQVTIDIKPGNDSNPINPKSKGVVPVAILTTDDFDAATVDPLSVEFGPGGAIKVHGEAHIEDADGDGDLDLVLHFKTQEAGIQCGDTEASLTGETFGGHAIEGSDHVNSVGCK